MDENGDVNGAVWAPEFFASESVLMQTPNDSGSPEVNGRAWRSRVCRPFPSATLASHDIPVPSEVIPNASAHHGLPLVPFAERKNREARKRFPSGFGARERAACPRIPARALEVRGCRRGHFREPGRNLGQRCVRYCFGGALSEAIAVAFKIVRDFV